VRFRKWAGHVFSVNHLPFRKPNRLSGYDYSQNGAYFVTVCVRDRHELLGQINVGATVPGRPRVELSKLGKCVDNAITYYNTNNGGVFFDRFVIMPNHIHLIIVIRSQ
jgi:REP element-mobilizing transposase RayT